VYLCNCTARAGHQRSPRPQHIQVGVLHCVVRGVLHEIHSRWSILYNLVTLARWSFGQLSVTFGFVTRHVAPGRASKPATAVWSL